MVGFESKGETLKSEDERIRATKLLRVRRKILLAVIAVFTTYMVWKLVSILVSGTLLLTEV